MEYLGSDIVEWLIVCLYFVQSQKNLGSIQVIWTLFVWERKNLIKSWNFKKDSGHSRKFLVTLESFWISWKISGLWNVHGHSGKLSGGRVANCCPESFCASKFAIWKVFAFSVSDFVILWWIRYCENCQVRLNSQSIRRTMCFVHLLFGSLGQRHTITVPTWSKPHCITNKKRLIFYYKSLRLVKNETWYSSIKKMTKSGRLLLQS